MMDIYTSLIPPEVGEKNPPAVSPCRVQVKDLINKALEGVNLKEGLSRRRGMMGMSWVSHENKGGLKASGRRKFGS